MNTKLKLYEENFIGRFMFILLILQPILDVVSYFMGLNDKTIITTMLRMVMFAVIALYAFFLSDNKKVYFIMGGVLVVFWLFHMIACFAEGYQSLYQDIMMYVRTIQMPVLTLCFITFFKHCRKMPTIIQKSFVYNYLIITLVILMSYITGMTVATYDSGVGVKGWFAIGNSQSCIIALLAPLAIYMALRVEKWWLLFIVALLVFGNMYFFGTKVTYYAIPITIVGALVCMALNKYKYIWNYMVLILLLCSVLLGYKVSPCYKNQYLANISVSEWNANIAQVKANSHKTGEAHKNNDNKKIDYDEYKKIYNLYLEDLVERFGIKKVAKVYNYSTEASDLINNRNLKVNYSKLVMKEKNTFSKFFGFEYMDFIMKDRVYDPENDFPAIYFSNGIVGLLMYAVFLAGFALMILKRGTKRFKDIITMEMGAVVVSFLLILGSAQFSGNVLRRPNVSIYLSVILAYIFYLCVIKPKKKPE